MKHREPLCLLDQLKINVSAPPRDAWRSLERLGYSMQAVKRPSDPAGKTSYRILDNGIPVTEFEGALTWEQATARREQYARGELARLEKLEQEKSE